MTTAAHSELDQCIVLTAPIKKEMPHWLKLEPRPVCFPLGVNGAIPSLPKQGSYL